MHIKTTLNYSPNFNPLKRDKKDFLNHITNIIDLLEKNEVPDYNLKCNECSFVLNQKKLENQDQKLYTDIIFNKSVEKI